MIESLIKFAFLNPYYFFMGWLLIALINMFIFMMLERAIYRKKDYYFDQEEIIESCANWNTSDWILTTLLSIFVPFGWVVIFVIIAKEFSPMLVKEIEWPKNQKKNWIGKSGA